MVISKTFSKVRARGGLRVGILVPIPQLQSSSVPLQLPYNVSSLTHRGRGEDRRGRCLGGAARELCTRSEHGVRGAEEDPRDRRIPVGDELFCSA